MTKSKIPFRPRPLSYAVASVLAVGAAAAAFGIPQQAQAKGESADDTLAPVCEPGLDKAATSDDILALYEIGDGTMISAPALPDAASNCMKLTAAGYSLSLDGLGLTVVSGGANPVTYLGSDRSLTLDTAAPVLCESYFAGVTGYKISATNSNDELLGGASGLRGISSMAYNPSSGTITPNLTPATYGPWINCISKNTANTRGDATTFSGSFESGPDIHVAYLDEAGNPLAGNEVFATIDGPSATVSYKVRITNRGDSAVTGIRLREYLPKTTSGLIVPTVTASGCLNDVGSPSCAADAYGALSLNFSSLPAPGAGPAGEDNTLAPGESVTYELTRTVNSSTAGAIAETFVAAFVNPDTTNDFKPGNNARQLRIVLQDNALPTAANKSHTTAEDTPVGVTFTGSDSDGSIVGWSIASQPSHGTLSGSGNSRTYTPAADFFGTDSFTYRAVDDDGGQSAPATVTITVTPVNDAPRAVGSIADQLASEGDAEYTINFNAATAFMDPEGAALTYSISGQPSGVTINPSTGQVSNVLPFGNNSSGVYPITVTATEAGVGSAQQLFTLTVTNVNQQPSFTLSSANDQSDDEGDSPSFDVSGFFSDPDGDTPLFTTASALPAGLSLSASGVFSGTVSQTAAGSYPITVTANDQQGGTVDGSFTWTINAVNVAPQVTGSIADRNVVTGVGFGVPDATLLAAFSDPDGDSLSISGVSGLPSNMNYFPGVGITGSVDSAGTYPVTVTATDGSLTADAMFTIFASSAD